jgi:DNA-directed RNA polymerase specialized sigma24 family protein
VISVVIDAKRRRSSTELPVTSVRDRVGVDDHDRTADRDLLTRCLATVPARQRACLVLLWYRAGPRDGVGRQLLDPHLRPQ